MATVVIENLDQEIEIPGKGILSRTIYKNSGFKAVVFGFAAREELSEHTASRPAVIHLLQGEALVTLGDRKIDARAGTWIYMAPGTPHRIVAHTELAFVLYLV